MFVEGDYNLAEWVQSADEIRNGLQGEKRKAADRYTREEFAIIVFIEQHYASFDPYDDLQWIYEY